MINVNKITSTLAKLPDQQLQQYAQMHKSDPYIMALAMSESNRRKEMRAAGQGAQGMQEQPKVVDQMVAEMAPQQLPEEMGIGQLPAGNMDFAGGGIVAFADGGDVERYNGTQGSFVDDGSAFAPSLITGLGYQPQQESSALGRSITDFFTRSDDLDAIRQNARTKQAQGLPLSAQEKAVLQADAQPNPAASRQPSALEQERTRNMQQVANEGYTRGDPRALPSMPSAAEQLAASNAAPTADTGRKNTERKDTGRKDTAAKTETDGLAGLRDPAKLYQEILAKQDYKDPAADALLELEARERASAAKDRQAIVDDAERFKDAYKGREARFAEREADIGKQKGTNTGLAFLNAGLAIMSTPGGLATAIGKGAQVGTAQFAAGLDKIRSAQERLTEARDRLDDLKLNREETTAKELRAAERNYRDVATNAQKRTIDGIRTAANVNRTDAKNIYDKTLDVQKTMYEQGEQTKRARMQVNAANRPGAEIQAVERIMAEKKIPFTEALALYKNTQREGVSEEKLRGDWLDQAKRLQIAQDYPNVKTFEDYKTVMGMGGGAGDFKVVGVRPAK